MSDIDDGVETRQDFESRDDVKDRSGLVRMWLAALDAASDEEESWRTEAELIVKRYRQEEAAATTAMALPGADFFNILFSSVETILPAVYNSVAIPDVRRRFNDQDKVGKTGAQMLERCLSAAVDAYDFEGTVRAAVKDNELVGRGVTRVRYVPYTRKDQQTGETVAWEEVQCEHVGWENFRHGPAKRWQNVNWVAFEQFYTRDQLHGLCESPEVAGKVRLDVEVAKTRQNDSAAPPPDIFMRARVWEIWDKETLSVVWVAPSYREAPIRMDSDPLELKNFFPVACPLTAIDTSETLVPVPPYRQYRRQAEELDIITQRLMKLTQALRWRGIYDSTIKELPRLSSVDDGDFVPMENAQALYAQAGGLEKAIYLMPIERLIIVIDKLAQQRELTKQNIFEITGSADIMRGQTDPRETKGAQQIKANWGSLRVQLKQRAVQKYAADLLNLKSEIIAGKFAEETILAMSNMELPTRQEKAMAQAQIQQQQQRQMAQQQMQQRPQQPQQPQLPPPGAVPTAQSQQRMQ